MIDPVLDDLAAAADRAFARLHASAELIRSSCDRLTDARLAAERARIRAAEVRALTERIATETGDGAP